MTPKEDLRDWLVDNWNTVEDEILKAMKNYNKELLMQGEKFDLTNVVDKNNLADEISGNLKMGILNVIDSYDDSESESGWKKLTTREADEEERTQGYVYMYDCEIPDLFEECLVCDGKYIQIDTWTEFDIGIGFENSDPDCWWRPLPKVPGEKL